MIERLETRTLLADFTAGSVAELIAAMDAANQTPEADTITLAPGATFSLAEVNHAEHGATGLPLIAPGQELEIIGSGSTIERSVAVGTPPFRLFAVAAGASLALKGLTLQNGLASGQAAWGGAIFNQGELRLEGATVRNNAASGGTVLSPVHPFGWSAAGGAIYSTGLLTLIDSVVRDNRAIGGSGRSAGSARGGGLFAGVAELRNVTLVGNTAQAGSGHSATGGRNSTGAPGGAALGGGLYLAGGAARLHGVSISSNAARGGNGGGARRCTPGGCGILGRGGNGGDGSGGGIYAAGGALTLRASTVAQNSAMGGTAGVGRPLGVAGRGKGGGLYISSSAEACLDLFSKSRVKQNEASTGGRNVAGIHGVCP